MHGLDEYDSEARWYYPAIMRTTTIDPLAEKYYSISPYAWCGNNPVMNVDPDGMQYITSTFINEKGEFIEYRPDNDNRVYKVRNEDEWRKNGSKKEDAEHVGFEYNYINYSKYEKGDDVTYFLWNGSFAPSWYNDRPLEIDNTFEEMFIPTFSWLKYFKFGGKIFYKLTAKITKQMTKRGWTEKLISKTLKSNITRTATNKSSGNKATAFFAKDGSYVVKDDITNEIIQVSNRADPNWIPDQTIINPYIPKK